MVGGCCPGVRQPAPAARPRSRQRANLPRRHEELRLTGPLRPPAVKPRQRCSGSTRQREGGWGSPRERPDAAEHGSWERRATYKRQSQEEPGQPRRCGCFRVTPGAVRTSFNGKRSGSTPLEVDSVGRREWLRRSGRLSRRLLQRRAPGQDPLRRLLGEPDRAGQKPGDGDSLKVEEIETGVSRGHVEHRGNGRARLG